MNTRFILLLVLLAFFFHSNAQTIDSVYIAEIITKIDSFGNNAAVQKGIDLAEETLKTIELNEGAVSHQVKILNKWGQLLRENGKYRESAERHQKAINLIENTNSHKTQLAKSYELKAEALKYIPDDEYKILYQKALALWKEIYGHQHFNVANIYITYGELDFFAGRLIPAAENLEQALTILENLEEQQPKLLVRVYYYLSNINIDNGDYYQAKTYSETALAIAKTVFPPQHFIIGITHNAIGTCYKKMKNYEKAFFHLEKNLAIQIQNFGTEHPNVALAYNNLGVVHYEAGNYQEALNYHKKEQNISLKTFDENHAHLGLVYGNIAGCYHRLGAYAEALKVYPKAIKILSNSWGEQNKYLALYHREFSDLYLKLKDFEKAKLHAEKSLKANNFHPERLEQTMDFQFLLLTFHIKAKIALTQYAQTQNQKYLQEAWQTYQEALSYSESIRTQLTEAKSFRSILNNIYVLYEGILQTCYQLHQTTQNEEWLIQAFQYMERSKSRLLLQSIMDASAQRSRELPDTLLKQEIELKKIIGELEQQRFEAEQTNNDFLQNVLIQQIFNKKEAQKELTATFKTQYPEYYELKFKVPNLPIEPLQEKLQDQTALIEYFMGDTLIFIFTLTKTNGLKMYMEEIPPTLHSQMEQFYTQTTQLKSSPEKIKEFQKSGSYLYQQLLAKPLSELPALINQLIIIPDGALAYLPFETLVPPTDEDHSIFSSLPFLNQKYTISYALSAQLLLEQQKRKTKPAQLFAGFAPNYDDSTLVQEDTISQPQISSLLRNGQYDLKGTKKEVEAIAALLRGQAFLNEAANERTFKQQAERYRILHLAMHSLIEEQNPMFSKLLFAKNPSDTLEDSYLNAIELYNMELNADLAVLSACNTGYGQIKRGEGIMSLARAFHYAGVPSTVMSLWKVPDQQTAEIMTSFYKNLKAGQTKDKALQAAKLAYLENVKAPELAHPFYWAGFIVVGDTAIMDLGGNGIWWWILGGVVVVLVLLVLYGRRNTNSEL